MRFLTVLWLIILALVSAGAIIEGSMRAISTSGIVAFNLGLGPLGGRWSIRIALWQYRPNRAYYRLEVVRI